MGAFARRRFPSAVGPGWLICPCRVDVRARALRVFTVEMAIMVGGQTIQARLVQARETAEVTVESGTCQITVEPGITRAPHYQPGHQAA
jgi:hypothetical protein